MIRKFLSLVKFSHTVFALPFALVGYALGVRVAGFDWVILAQVVLCMVFARSAAMAFNRLVDREFDAKNPRTATREIPAGALSPNLVATIVVVCSVLFVLTALSINLLCFALSPVALAVVLGYSYTKRFTSWCHLVLGLGLAIAPVGGYIAAAGGFSTAAWLLAGLVLTWVAGFDVLFALQDQDFDQSTGLHSIPARFGIKKALYLSGALHGLTTLAVVGIGCAIHPAYPIIYWIGALVFVGLLAFQHAIVRPWDLSRVNLAFGTTNGIASIAYAVAIVLSLALWRTL